jgi:CTP synthase
MQILAIEFARHFLSHGDAHNTEMVAAATAPIGGLMPDPGNLQKTGRNNAIGQFPLKTQPGNKGLSDLSKVRRKRHQYEFHNDYHRELKDLETVFLGMNSDSDLVEILELKNHLWFVGVQFSSKLHRTQTLFRDFIAAGLTIWR